MERNIRALKRDALAQDAMGDKSALAASKIKLDEKMAAYTRFSSQTNIRAKLERTAVIGYDRGVAARGRSAAIWRSKLTEIGNTGVLYSDAQFGAKIGKHARDFGLDPGSAEDRTKFLEIIRGIISQCDEVRAGNWRGWDGPISFFIRGDDVVAVSKNKEFITILKGGLNNARVKNARKQ